MAESGGRVRARNLLSSYYGVQEETGAASAVSADEDEMNIDSNAFAVDKYVGTLLQYKSLEELVQRGNAMVSEIKSLDSDMQMLVYENYNKFISATDTIRQMKQRVEEMEVSASRTPTRTPSLTPTPNPNPNPSPSPNPSPRPRPDPNPNTPTR